MQDKPVLFRKRLIPKECIQLKDDVILLQNDSVIITSWKALKPRKHLHHGFSIYYLKEGYKVSRFYREDHSLMYHYCDIVQYEYKEDLNHLIITDLLADVVISPTGQIKVIDLDEFVTALEEDSLSIDQLKTALLSLDRLLKLLYENGLTALTEPLLSYDMESKA